MREWVHIKLQHHGKNTPVHSTEFDCPDSVRTISMLLKSCMQLRIVRHPHQNDQHDDCQYGDRWNDDLSQRDNHYEALTSFTSWD